MTNHYCDHFHDLRSLNMLVVRLVLERSLEVQFSRAHRPEHLRRPYRGRRGDSRTARSLRERSRGLRIQQQPRTIYERKILTKYCHHLRLHERGRAGQESFAATTSAKVLAR